MNDINFDQLGGFPLETNTLSEMQKAYSIFNALGELAGNKTIISGCIEIGNEVSSGFVYLNGELLQFKGGLKQSKIIIKEDVQEVEFEDKTVKPVYKTRYATFGTGINAILWSDFTRVNNLMTLNSALFIDEIRMYAGGITNIPVGWYLCDGSNNTADLRGRFIVGYDLRDNDYSIIGNYGGAKEVSLTEGQMPKHSHSMEDGAGGDDGKGWIVSGSDNGYQDLNQAKTKSAGNNEAHENRPPYFTLAFIQFKGF